MTIPSLDPILERLRLDSTARFERDRAVLSFEEYLDLVRANPARHARDAATYLADAVEAAGTTVRETPLGERRHHLALDDVGEPRLVGQELAEAAFVRAVRGFSRRGQANRLVLLLGPNGSAKSTFVRAVMGALERYSERDEGPLYRFTWVFPRERDGKSIGFGGAEERSLGGFAHLPEDRIQASLEDELRQHPLLLLPPDARTRFLLECGLPEHVVEAFARRALGAKNQRIVAALERAYRGDYAKVLGHVRVERFRISRRYRVGAVTIGPEMGVDAAERVIAVDRSAAMLPAALASATLVESHGELVDGQRGVVEFGDLLERPLEAWKYLLLAVESGEVGLRASTLSLDAVLLANSNDRHFEAFREHPAFASFRPRILTIRLPYLLDHRAEAEVYAQYVAAHTQARFGTHALFVAAFFAVLTRLRPPRREAYANPLLARAASSLRPGEKAQLYAEGVAPKRFDPESAKVLESSVALVADELREGERYEGRVGASPRELLDLLADAATALDGAVVTPIDVLDRLEALCRRTDLEFLLQKPVDGYGDPPVLLAETRARWLERVSRDFEQASGMLEADETERLFGRYVDHVVHWVKGERLTDARGERDQPPDEELMRRVEETLKIPRAEPHRRELLSTIASFALDHPGEKVQPVLVFPGLVEDLRRAYYEQKGRALVALLDDVLVRVDGSDISDAHRREAADATLKRLREDFGYDDATLRASLGARRAGIEGHAWT